MLARFARQAAPPRKHFAEPVPQKTLYTGIGFSLSMAARKTIGEVDLRTYYERRTKPLARRLLDLAEDLFSAESIQQSQQFEDQVERRLRNGAKFVPRKRQSG